MKMGCTLDSSGSNLFTVYTGDMLSYFQCTNPHNPKTWYPWIFIEQTVWWYSL